jgi:hypothetical protein
MPEREKVIKGLECCNGEAFCIGEKCPYFDDKMCVETLHSDAIALLKAQGPRMMTLEEAFHNANTYRTSPDSVKPVFVQFRFEEYADEGLCPPWRGGVNQRELLGQTGAYGRDYVFWTDRPTKEQMEAVQWPDA